MTAYSYIAVDQPNHPKPTIFALHSEPIQARAEEIVDGHEGEYDHAVAVADAEGEAMVNAVEELGGAADWYNHEGWSVTGLGPQPHPSMIAKAGGQGAIRWADAMPALP